MIAPNPHFSVAARAEVAAALVAAVPPNERTLNVELLAESFVDAYDDPTNARRPLALVEWIGRMCDVHGEDPGVFTLFSVACTTIERYVGSRTGPFHSAVPIRTLDDSIAGVVAKRRPGVAAPSNRLHEVDAALNALIQKLDRSDPLSADHSRAVSAWCGRIARRLSLSETATVQVARCGLIHDIGKLTTPYDILHAPRKLTESEWEIMRAHTTAGERIIREYPNLVGFARTTRSHHERLDGRGYPDGLGGDDIPLDIRIVTVSDSFNAMIGRRPYRPPMMPAAALGELERCAGSQFDPTVVAAMRDVILGLRNDPDAIGHG